MQHFFGILCCLIRCVKKFVLNVRNAQLSKSTRLFSIYYFRQMPSSDNFVDSWPSINCICGAMPSQMEDSLAVYCGTFWFCIICKLSWYFGIWGKYLLSVFEKLFMSKWLIYNIETGVTLCSSVLLIFYLNNWTIQWLNFNVLISSFIFRIIEILFYSFSPFSAVFAGYFFFTYSYFYSSWICFHFPKSMLVSNSFACRWFLIYFPQPYTAESKLKSQRTAAKRCLFSEETPGPEVKVPRAKDDSAKGSPISTFSPNKLLFSIKKNIFILICKHY